MGIIRRMIGLKRTTTFVLTSLCLCTGLATYGAPTAITQAQCLQNNWTTVGYNDGKQGQYLQQALQDYITACAKYHATISRAAYSKGWHAGVRVYCRKDHGYALGESGQLYNNICPPNMIVAFNSAWNKGINAFCTVKNGFKLGLNGKPFPGFCPPWSDAQFNRAYNRGRVLYKTVLHMRKQLRMLNAQVQSAQNTLQSQQQRLDRLQTQLLQKNLSPLTRKNTRRQVNHANRQVNHQENNLVQLKQQQSNIRRAIAKIEKRHS